MRGSLSIAHPLYNIATYVPVTPSDMALLSSGVGCGCGRAGNGGAVSSASGKKMHVQ